MIRVIQLRSRNPVVGTLVALALLLLVLAVLVAGATLLAGVAVVGGVLGGAVLLARRVLGLGRRPAPPLPPLDPANEVFLDPSREVFPPGDAPRRLPPA
jgi:hypothetical protein